MKTEREGTDSLEVERPVLSLIVCSRNDDYQGGAVWRLETGLNLTARTVHDLGLEDSVEIILTDWGSEVPIREALCLTPQAAHLLSVVEVPRPVAEKHQRDAPFSEVHALNAAARRARGEYIARIDQDTVLGSRFLEVFFELYRGERSARVPLERALMLSNRRSVPYRMAAMRPSPWVIDRFIRWFGPMLRVADPLPDDEYYKSYVGMWMIHRDLWFEIGGYDESFVYMNWMEVDMILRLEPECSFVNLGRLIDHDIYHLDHAHPLAYWGARGRLRRENPVRDRDHMPDEAFPNSKDWGLAKEVVQRAPYAVKPGEAEAALEPFERAQWGAFLFLTTRFGVRFALDKAALALIAVARVGPRLVLALAPGLREPWAAYADAVSGYPLSQWPRLLRERRRSRRLEGGSGETA